MANKFSTNLKSLTMKVFASGMKTLPSLSLIAVALCLFAGAAHADILVSNHTTGYIELFNDDGTLINARFINVGLGGTNTTEGLACVKLSSNEIYAANAQTNTIGIYSLSDGHEVSSFNITGATGEFASVAINAAGSVLYVAGAQTPGTQGQIYAINVPVVPGGPCSPTTPCSVTTFAEHDIVIGPDGNIYATGIGNNTGVIQFSPYVPNSPSWSPTSSQFIAPGAGGGGNFLTSAGGMVFDGSGNLWVTNTTLTNPSAEGIFLFTGPQNPRPHQFLDFTPDANAAPFGMDVSPVNPPSPPVDSCKGCTIIANYTPGTITQIDPSSCTGVIGTPGTCTMQPFFSTGASPKYPKFTENCCDTGYVEICKLSCLADPVTGNFSFTATNQGVQFGPLSVPVNACSGAIQVPNGTVTINETQKLGTEVTDILAYNYNYLGDQISALLSSNPAFTTANVDVVSGDVSTETIAEFTNCNSGPGELKICKVAGGTTPIDTPFYFYTSTGSRVPVVTMVPAGPPPEGYCEVVNATYPVGTQVTVSEPPSRNQGYQVSNITVDPPDRQGTTTPTSVVAVIDSGTTEVTFTNIPMTMGGQMCPAGNVLYNDEPVNGTVDAYTINFTWVTSDTFDLPANGSTVTGLCFYAWLTPGDTVTSVEASITAGENSGASYFDHQVSLTCSLTCSAGQSFNGGVCGLGSYNVYECSAQISGPTLNSGTYWLNLQNAISTLGNAVYWDENFGPSLASQNNGTGTIPAEAFLIYGH